MVIVLAGDSRSLFVEGWFCIEFELEEHALIKCFSIFSELVVKKTLSIDENPFLGSSSYFGAPID